MLGPPRTLRSRLLAAMIGTALVALAVAYLVVADLQRSGEHAADLARTHHAAAVLARRVTHDLRADRDDLDRAHLAVYQALLGDGQLVVRHDGRVLFAGAVGRTREVEASVSLPVPHGSVTVRDFSAPGHKRVIVAAVVGGGVAVVVIAAAIVVATLLTRAVREPVRRAIDAADRLAAGDLSARMGLAGPQELAHLGRAFDSMAERLQDAERDQRRFLADVAHEIATPTNTISGFGLALADGTVRGDAERAEAAQLIEHETARLRALLDDLRELTRLDLAETVHRDAVDLRALCERVVARVAHDARAAGVTVTVHVGAGTIVSDERLLDTILSNLVANAIRHTPPGGRVQIARRRRRPRRETVLAVSDTGVGIAAEHHERIFDRLYRVDASRGRNPGGSGLGLPIAQRAAHALGGRIELSSEPGQGSEFRLVLPDERQPAPAEPTPG